MDKFNSSFAAVSKNKVKNAAENLIRLVKTTRKEAFERAIKRLMQPYRKGFLFGSKEVVRTREQAENYIKNDTSSIMDDNYDEDISYSKIGGEYWVGRANDLLAAVKFSAQENIYLSLEDVKIVNENYRQ